MGLWWHCLMCFWCEKELSLSERQWRQRVYKGGNRWEGNGLETAANVWVLFYFETDSLSLPLSLSPFSFTFWFMFQSILFVMEKWESGLKCMGGIGPLFFLVFEIVPFRFTFSFIPSLNFFLCSSSMIYLSFFLVLEVLIYSVEVVSGVWTKLVHLWISKH